MNDTKNIQQHTLSIVFLWVMNVRLQTHVPVLMVKLEKCCGEAARKHNWTKKTLSIGKWATPQPKTERNMMEQASNNINPTEQVTHGIHGMQIFSETQNHSQKQFRGQGQQSSKNNELSSISFTRTTMERGQMSHRWDQCLNACQCTNICENAKKIQKNSKQCNTVCKHVQTWRIIQIELVFL